MFMLVSRRYGRASLIVTSNKPFSAWGEIFGDDVVAAAMIDRLVHHAEILALEATPTGSKTATSRTRQPPEPPKRPDRSPSTILPRPQIALTCPDLSANAPSHPRHGTLGHYRPRRPADAGPASQQEQRRGSIFDRRQGVSFQPALTQSSFTKFQPRLRGSHAARPVGLSLTATAGGAVGLVFRLRRRCSGKATWQFFYRCACDRDRAQGAAQQRSRGAAPRRGRRGVHDHRRRPAGGPTGTCASPAMGRRPELARVWDTPAPRSTCRGPAAAPVRPNSTMLKRAQPLLLTSEQRLDVAAARRGGRALAHPRTSALSPLSPAARPLDFRQRTLRRTKVLRPPRSRI